MKPWARLRPTLLDRYVARELVKDSTLGDAAVRMRLFEGGQAAIDASRDPMILLARAIDEELRPAIEILKVQTNPIAIKRALQLLGHDVGGLRLPLVEADEAETARIRDCLARLGLLSPVAA